MNRKDYTRPTMKVVKLQHQCHILVVSGQEQQGQKQQYQSEEW